MNGILFDSQPFWGSREIANLVGANGAIAIQQIHFWCSKNKENNRNFHKGRYWTYNTYEDWQENCLTWLSVSGIKKCLTTLEKDGYIVSDNFNKIRTDRTKWYAVNYEKLYADVNVNEQKRLEAKRAKEQSRIDTKCPMEKIHSVRSIPEYTYQNDTEKEFSVSNSENAVADVKEARAREIRKDVYKRGTETAKAVFDNPKNQWAIDLVNTYINDWYEQVTGHKHPQFGKSLRMFYAYKLIECKGITENDRCADLEPKDFVQALKQGIAYHDCPDPTIMWITDPKVLGYWLVESGGCFYQDIMGTKYGFSDDAETAFESWQDESWD